MALDYLNIHTHHPAREGEQTFPSFGLHPWYLTEAWQEEVRELEGRLNAMNRGEAGLLENQGKGELFFIGECGLDRLCDTPYERQLAAFEAQIRLSEQLQRPLILHCVRATDDVLRLKRGTRQPWVFHGFRGKPQQLRQLLVHGFYVSFGFRYNVSSLQACPPDRLFLETDDSPTPIERLYAATAPLLGTTPEALNRQVWQNLSSLA